MKQSYCNLRTTRKGKPAPDVFFPAKHASEPELSFWWLASHCCLCSTIFPKCDIITSSQEEIQPLVPNCSFLLNLYLKTQSWAIFFHIWDMGDTSSLSQKDPWFPQLAPPLLFHAYSPSAPICWISWSSCEIWLHQHTETIPARKAAPQSHHRCCGTAVLKNTHSKGHQRFLHCSRGQEQFLSQPRWLNSHWRQLAERKIDQRGCISQAAKLMALPKSQMLLWLWFI